MCFHHSGEVCDSDTELVPGESQGDIANGSTVTAAASPRRNGAYVSSLVQISLRPYHQTAAARFSHPELLFCNGTSNLAQ